MNIRRMEKGQAVALLTLAMLALLGFAALAVDGGQVFAERRRAQNAADSAALSAAGAYTRQEDHVIAALDQALTNGYDGNGVTNTVLVSDPPFTDPYSNDKYFQVTIWEQLNPIFAHFVFPGALQFTVEAVARVTEEEGISPGDAIHSLNQDADSLIIDGNIDLSVFNGNIRSNGGAIKHGQPGVVSVTNAHIYTASGWSNTSNVSPLPERHPLMKVNNPPAPDCNLPRRTVSEDMQPGRYRSINISGNGTFVMEPGIYCVENGIDIRGNTTVIGEGIFIVMLGGEIRINGTSKVDWQRANDIKDPSGHQYGGMLIYVPPSNPNRVILTGDNGTTFRGTIFAPTSQCDAGGNNVSIGLYANIVCDKVRLHGNPDMSITYREVENYQNPPMIELVK